jgi:hypothetical protein
MDQLIKVVKKAGFKVGKTQYLTHYSILFNHLFVYVGFRLRTSPKLSRTMKNSMSKFHPSSKRTWFSYVLAFINRLDQRNDRKIRPGESSVGLFVEAKK